MSFRDYLLLMGGGTVASWIAWAVVLFGVDPVRSGGIGFLLFYLTLALALIGTFSVSGTAVRVWRHKNELVSRQVARSLRQAILFAVIILGSLMLMGAGLFRWWTAGLLILALALVELAFVSGRRLGQH